MLLRLLAYLVVFSQAISLAGEGVFHDSRDPDHNAVIIRFCGQAKQRASFFAALVFAMKDSTATKLANLRPWQPGQSGNPLGRRSDKTLVDHVLASTRGGAELGDILLSIARTGRREKDRIEACDVLLDRLYGKVSAEDQPALFGALRGATELRFSAAFGPRRAPGDEAIDGGVVEVEAIEAEASRVDAEGTAESDAADAETPVETPESVETAESPK